MITLGTDPEFFLVDKKGSPVAVCDKIGGTKGHALDIGGGFAVQEDNVMVEWNIEPRDNAESFALTCRDGFDAVKRFVRTRLPDVEAKLSPAMVFSAKELASDKAKEFGCSPDFNAYGRGEAFERLDPQMFTRQRGGGIRFAGGHVHIGYDNPEDIPGFVVAAMCDLYLGLPSITEGDAQEERRRYYGQPGRYRPTEYGIEYRTLSNYWLRDVDTSYMVGQRAMALGNLIENAPVDTIQRAFADAPWGDVQRAIIEEDSKLAAQLRRYFQRGPLQGWL